MTFIPVFSIPDNLGP